MIYAAYIKCIKDMHSFSFTKQMKTANPIRKFSPGNYSLQRVTFQNFNYLSFLSPSPT